MIDNLPNDMLNYILNFLDIYSQISFVNTCKNFKTKIKIKNLYVPMRFSYKITKEILKKYPYIEKLNLYCNRMINNLNNYKFIRILNISNCSVSFDGIKNLTNIKELNITNNINYIDLTVFKKLEILTIDGLTNISVHDLNTIQTLKTIYARNSNVESVLVNVVDKRIKLILNY